MRGGQNDVVCDERAAAYQGAKIINKYYLVRVGTWLGIISTYYLWGFVVDCLVCK